MPCYQHAINTCLEPQTPRPDHHARNHIIVVTYQVFEETGSINAVRVSSRLWRTDVCCVGRLNETPHQLSLHSTAFVLGVQGVEHLGSYAHVNNK